MEIYISYCWAPPFKAIMQHWLCPILDANHIHYNIDVKDCKFGDDIVDFEKKIGKAENVLIMLSKPYFYSSDCMYELALMMKNNWYGKHLIWVNVDDFKSDDDNECITIYKYWQKQENQLSDKIREDANMGRLFQDDLKRIQFINKYFPEAWRKMKRSNTLTFEDVASNGFQKLLVYIRNELMMEDSIIEEPDTNLPLDVGEAPSGTTIIQNGNNNVAATVNNGGEMTINMK